MEKRRSAEPKEEVAAEEVVASSSKRKRSVTPKSVEPRTPLKRHRLPVHKFQSPAEEFIPTPSTSKAHRDEVEMLHKKGAFLGVRGDEETFYLCKTGQNVFANTRKFKIQWLDIAELPDVYKIDFMDTTDADCILTNVRMGRVARDTYRLPEKERTRVQAILDKALAKERGEPIDDIVIEDNDDDDDDAMIIDTDDDEEPEPSPAKKVKTVKPKSPPKPRRSSTVKAKGKASKSKKDKKTKDKKKEKKKKEKGERKKGPDRNLKPNPKIKVLDKDPFFETKTMDYNTTNTGKDCEICAKSFKHKKDLFRHQRTVHGGGMHQCQVCGTHCSRHDALLRHERTHSLKRTYTDESNLHADAKKMKYDDTSFASSSDNNELLEQCNWCSKEKTLLPGKKFCSSCGDLGRECRCCHRPLPERLFGKRTDVCDSCVTRPHDLIDRQKQQHGGGEQALEGTAQTVALDSVNELDVLHFFKDNEASIVELLMDRMKHVKGIKWFFTLFVKFVKYDQNNEPVYAEPVFRSISLSCTNTAQLDTQLAEAFQHVHNAYQNFERDGSGWTIDKIIKLKVSTVEYAPLEGSSYLPLPPKIQKKKAVLNIQNTDQKCFLWSVLAGIHHVTDKDHPERVNRYTPYETELKCDDLDFPVALSQIPAFEKRNGISVNVFGLELNDVYPLQITSHRNMTRHVNLLLFSKGEQRHYCLIRNLSRLLGDRTSHNGQTYYCNYCLHGFSRQDLLDEHVPYCSPHGPQKLSFPKSEDKQWVYFNQVRKQLRVPFVVYADFESFVKPIDTCDPDPSKSSTTKYQKHEPSGYSFMIKCTNDELSKPAVVYRGPNVTDNFFKRLLDEEQQICKILSKVKPMMKLTPDEERSFQEAIYCHICDEELEDRMRDHDHLTGQYRGAAHTNCNFQYQFQQGKRSFESKFFIPVIFHNLSGYDMHLLMASAGKYKSKPISCIPNNMEKYISFSLGSLRFIDSLQFLNASLDTLVTNLRQEEDVSKFGNLAKHFPNKKEFDLLLRKGVYPYDYITSPEKFEETCLPSREKFYNKLNDTELSDDDYRQAQAIWETFGMASLGDLHDLYLKTDVILLSEVFENFRSLCLKYYRLDPAHYYTLPGYSWDAMLKMTGVHIELLDDIDMVNLIEKGVRGGISMILKKFAQANNPEASHYDHTKPNTWLTYLDMNNLYGTAMCEPLPKEDFYWLDETERERLDISKLSDTADTGYILEVDLDYPASLHDEHNDYPLAPDSLAITDTMLSDHSKQLKKQLGIKGKASTKLVPTLESKRNYVVHYRNLKYYLSKGLVLRTVHRAIAFKQSCWLKPYIDFNTEKRKLAKTNFEKDLFKLANNSIFGKTLENMRKRVNVELVNTPKRLRKLCAKPNFQSFKIFNEDLVAVNMKKTNIVLNRPICAGFCILDISKVFMYQFHYDFIKPQYGGKAQLLFTDTDSLCYEIETDNWYQDMKKNQDLFDTSNFEKDHPLYSNTNSKVLGKMKDECGGKIVEQFVGLRPKMYSLLYSHTETVSDKYGIEHMKKKQCAIKRAKGVKKCVVNKQLKHDMYIDCLEKQCSLRHSMNFIRSFDHQLYSITVQKTSLSPYDDKRYFTGIESFAYGHFRSHQ